MSGIEHTSGELGGRVALVTAGGGAIGAATCRRLAAHGAHVVCADVDEARANAVVEDILTSGGRGTAVVADATTRPGVDDVVDAASSVGTVQVLVNGLGEHLGSSGPFEESDEDEWQDLYEVNLLHVFRFCQALLPGMFDQGWGRVVNFSSVEGIRAAPALAVYTAFKRAVDGFTRSVAVDVAGSGVLVNAVAVDKTRAHQTGHYELPGEYERLVPVWIPAGRYAEGDDIARVVHFLASDLNTWITGQTIVADGGTLAAGGWYRTPTRWTNQPLLVQYFEEADQNANRPPMVQ